MPKYFAADVEVRLSVCDAFESLTSNPGESKGDKNTGIKSSAAEEVLSKAVTLIEEPIGCLEEDGPLHFIGREESTPLYVVKVRKRPQIAELYSHMSTLTLASKSDFQRDASLASGSSGLSDFATTPDFSPSVEPLKPLDDFFSAPQWSPVTLLGQSSHTVQGAESVTFNKEALVLSISLTASTLRRSLIPTHPWDLKIDVYLNGTYTSSTLVSRRNVKDPPKPGVTERFGGERLDACVERAWLVTLCDEKLNFQANGFDEGRAAVNRWTDIAESLRSEADAVGLDEKGKHSKVGSYLNSLASLQAPHCIDSFQQPSCPNYAVMDVVLTLGDGQKVTPTVSYLKRPQRVWDVRYKPNGPSNVASLDVLAVQNASATRPTAPGRGQIEASAKSKNIKQDQDNSSSSNSERIPTHVKKPRFGKDTPTLTLGVQRSSEASQPRISTRQLRSHTTTPAVTGYSSRPTTHPAAHETREVTPVARISDASSKHEVASCLTGTPSVYDDPYLPVNSIVSSPLARPLPSSSLKRKPGPDRTRPDLSFSGARADEPPRSLSRDAMTTALPLLSFSFARSKRNSLPNDMQPLSTCLPPEPDRKKRRVTSNDCHLLFNDMPASSTIPDLSWTPTTLAETTSIGRDLTATELPGLSPSKASRRGALSQSSPSFIPALQIEKPERVERIVITGKNGSPIVDHALREPKEIRSRPRTRKPRSPLERLARSPTIAEKHELNKVGTRRVLFPPTPLGIADTSSQHQAKSSDFAYTLAPEEVSLQRRLEEQIKTYQSELRGQRRNLEDHSSDSEDASDKDPPYTVSGAQPVTAECNKRKKKPCKVLRLRMKPSAPCEEPEASLPRSKKKSTELKTKTVEPFPIPELTKDCVVSYAKEDQTKLYDAEGSHGVRQVRSQRAGNFQESEVLLGVRFILCADWSLTGSTDTGT